MSVREEEVAVQYAGGGVLRNGSKGLGLLGEVRE